MKRDVKINHALPKIRKNWRGCGKSSKRG